MPWRRDGRDSVELRLLLRALLVLVAAGSADAAEPEKYRTFINGSELQNRCELEDPIPCRAYIQGVIDGIWSAGMSPWRERLTAIEFRNGADLPPVVLRYLRDHSEARNWPAAQVVIVSVSEAFGNKGVK